MNNFHIHFSFFHHKVVLSLWQRTRRLSILTKLYTVVSYFHFVFFFFSTNSFMRQRYHSRLKLQGSVVVSPLFFSTMVIWLNSLGTKISKFKDYIISNENPKRDPIKTNDQMGFLYQQSSTVKQQTNQKLDSPSSATFFSSFPL